jgi:hypothetical protein
MALKRWAFLGSSMAEHAAVNRRVAGSSPARGASKGLMRMHQSLFLCHREEEFSQGAKEQWRFVLFMTFARSATLAKASN